MNNLRVMFLSKYADATPDMSFDDSAEKNYANYHIAFRESIRKIFKNLIITHRINDLIDKSIPNKQVIIFFFLQINL